MLVYRSKFLNTPVLSVQAGGPIGYVSEIIVDPDNLKTVAFRLAGPRVPRDTNLLDVASIREYSNFGIVIDSEDDLASPDDVVKIGEVVALNFNLIDLKVKTKKGTKLGKIIDYTLTSEDFIVQQIIVKRPTIKSFLDAELTIHRNEIVEVTDYEIIVKDEEKVIRAKAEKENFVPNFVNPFRNSEFYSSPTRTETPDDTDTA